MLKSGIVASALVAALLAGCGIPHVYRGETFDLDTPYRKQMATTPEIACEAARLALLGQGYALDVEEQRKVRGKKAFQPDDDEHAVLEFSVVCANHPQGSIIFANAVQSLYKVKETSDSASLGLPSLGSISLPWSSSVDSLVNTGNETVDDKKFYARFFRLVEMNLLDAGVGVSPEY